MGDEGGFAPDLPSAEAALEFCLVAVESAGLKPGRDVHFGLDCAASEFFRAGAYVYEGEKKTRSSEEQVEYLTASFETIRSSQLRTVWPKMIAMDGRL